MSNPVLLREVVEIAKTQIGTRPCDQPKDTNTKPGCRTYGTQIQVYQEASGLGSSGGHDYCGAFVFWCFQQAAKNTQQPSPLDGRRTASASGVLSQAKSLGAVVDLTTDRPRAGDVFVEFDGNSPSHVGIVASDVPAGGKTFSSIEGNTWIGSKTDKRWGVWDRKGKSIDGVVFARF